MLRHSPIILERVQALEEYAAHLERFRAMPWEDVVSDMVAFLNRNGGAP